MTGPALRRIANGDAGSTRFPVGRGGWHGACKGALQSWVLYSAMISGLTTMVDMVLWF